MMVSKIDLSAVKALSKEQRMNLASNIRKDPELWSVVNGIGGLSEKSANGLIIGNTTLKGEVLSSAKVILLDRKGAEKTILTNQYGFYKIELAPDVYSVTFAKGNGQSLPVDADLKSGLTLSVNYDFGSI